jgi:protein O-mannosyl-transferase
VDAYTTPPPNQHVVMAHVPFRALLLVTLFLLTVLAYWPGLGGDFLFDDFPAIVSNSGVHAEQLNLETLNKAARAFDPGLYGRPLAMITFAIDHSIWGKDSWATSSPVSYSTR